MQIDLQYLIEKNITPDFYVLLRLLKEKRYEELRVFNISIISLQDLVNNLVLNGYIIDIGNPIMFDATKLLLTKKGQDLFKTNLSGFEKLWGEYPHKVPNGRGGYRILKPLDIDCTLFRDLKPKYKAYVKGKPELEDKIYQALLSQLEAEKHSLMYFQQLSVWWNQKSFEKYFDVGIEKKENFTKEI